MEQMNFYFLNKKNPFAFWSFCIKKCTGFGHENEGQNYADECVSDNVVRLFLLIAQKVWSVIDRFPVIEIDFFCQTIFQLILQ